MTYQRPLTPEREARIESVAANRQRDIVLVLEDIHDPHNAAAIFRTCDALGIQKVHLIFQEQEPFSPRKIGKASSSSANKWLDFTVYTSNDRSATKTALTKLREEGYTLFATALRENAKDVYKIDFTKYDKIALLVGNEHSGLSPTALELSHYSVILPMRGFVESLNVSVATALFLSEITRQRQVAGGYLLNETEKAQLIENLRLKAS